MSRSRAAVPLGKRRVCRILKERPRRGLAWREDMARKARFGQKRSFWYGTTSAGEKAFFIDMDGVIYHGNRLFARRKKNLCSGCTTRTRRFCFDQLQPVYAQKSCSKSWRAWALKWTTRTFTPVRWPRRAFFPPRRRAPAHMWWASTACSTPCMTRASHSTK